VRRQLRLAEQQDFVLRDHRLLWATIGEIEEDHLVPGRLEAIDRGEDLGLELGELDLPRLLGDRLVVEQSDLLSRLTPLLQPSDVEALALGQPELQLRGAIASRSRLVTQNRCRHLLEAWRGQELQTLERCIARLLQAEASPPQTPEPAAAAPALLSHDMEDRIDDLFQQLNGEALRFQEAYYRERRHLLDLDRQRCSSDEETLRLGGPARGQAPGMAMGAP
jgi:DNA primase